MEDPRENVESGKIEPANEEARPNIGSELFGSRTEITKFFRTFVQVFRNVKLVVEDTYYKKGLYTTPVKYTLTVLAPVVLITQLLRLDIYGFLMETANTEIPPELANDPTAVALMQRFMEVYEAMVGYMFEFLPVFYAVIFIPIAAMWLKVFVSDKSLKFSYYYSVTTYLVMSVTFISLFFFLASYAGILPFEIYMYLGGSLNVLVFIYGCHLTFGKSWFRSIVNSVMSLGMSFLIIVIVMQIVGFGIAIFTLEI